MSINKSITMALGSVPDGQDIFPIASRLMLPLPQEKLPVGL